MPWYNGDYPPSYKNQPKYLREKVNAIANEVLKTTGNEGEAIATCLKQLGISKHTLENQLAIALKHLRLNFTRVAMVALLITNLL